MASTSPNRSLITSQSVAGRLKLGAILVVVLIATILLIDAVLMFAIQAEIDLVDQYGFGHVPRAKMDPFIQIGSASPGVAFALGLLKIGCFGYFLFQSAKALDGLGIAHRFSKIFTGLSIIIPFVSLYVPWAALGETRQTFKASLAAGATPAWSVRRFDTASFWLALVWIVDAIVGGVLARTGDVGRIVDLDSFQAALGKARGGLVIGMISTSMVAIVFIFYARGLLRLYRAVLLRSAADVFEGRSGLGSSPPPPSKDHVPSLDHS